jgi:preprotein translocase subunit SecY
MSLKDLLLNLPEVQGPSEKKLEFSKRLKWTLIILAFFFILSNIPLFKLEESALSRFEFLSIIFGANFGSLMSLGIGPIVTASIVLQLLVGSKLINIDLNNPEGKRFFEGLQKALSIFFVIFEASIYVLMKGLLAVPGFEWLVILQLVLGGFLVLLMDEVVAKYGFGSGVSLFIVGGVAWQLFAKAFGFLTIIGCPQGVVGCIPEVKIQASGKVIVLIQKILQADISGASVAIAAILATIIVFFVVVYTQSIKVEVPLSFGRIRGFNIRWPLSFFYTSNIPVILTAALHANLQLVAVLGQKISSSFTFLGVFDQNGVAQSGLAYWLSPPTNGIVEPIILGSLQSTMILRSLFYILFMVAGSIMFAIFWVKTSGMDASNQAQQISGSGLQVAGFRRDPRVIESILSRYIMPLTIMGGAAVGLIAALADITGALVRGTGILLSVMILYKMYEDIAQQHAMDSSPLAKKFIAAT